MPAGRRLIGINQMEGVDFEGETSMKGLAICTAAFGLLLATAATSRAESWYPGSYIPVHYHRHYYYPPARVVVTPGPVYGYPAYPTYPSIVAPYPVAPPATVVAPAPYYYGAPAAVFGYRGNGVAVRVGL